MRKDVALTFPLLTVMLLAACGGGDSSSPTPEPASADTLNYQPWANGNRWVYDDVSSESPDAYLTGKELAKLTGVKIVNGQKVGTLQMANLNDYRVMSSSLIAKREDTLVQVYDASGPLPYSALGEVVLLKFPVTAGDSYPSQEWISLDYGSDLDGDLVNETVNIKIDVSVLDAETVQVPVGTFEAALPVSTITTFTFTYSKDGSQSIYTRNEKSWYAAGIGVVKQVTTESFDGLPGSLITRIRLLSGYVVDGVSTETTKPTVAFPISAGNTTLGPDYATPTVRFSEPLDFDCLGSGVVTLKNSANQSVAGSAGSYSDLVLFMPQIPLPSGKYTLSINGKACDALGNTMGSTYSWTFTLDVDPPTVVSISPSNNAERVTIESDVSIDFSEPLDLATVPGNIRLSSASGIVPATLTNTDGIHFNLHPDHPLDFDKTYTVTIHSSVGDPYGNRLGSTQSFQFTTRPSLFLAPEYLLTGDWTEAVAVGDLNGDTRNDIVTVTHFSPPPPTPGYSEIFVYYQDSEGTLAAPRRYRTNASCGSSSIAIGDVSGDGIPDIILASGCDLLEIYERDESDDWFYSTSHAASGIELIRAGDMNHDGRIDIAGTNWGGSSRIWYQGPAGGLQSPQTYPLTNAGWPDLEIGDINSDGLDDIVVSSGQGIGPSVGIMTQLNSGGFNAPKYLTNESGSTNSIAIGDINGDGRQDLVESTAFGVLSAYPSLSTHALGNLAELDSSRRSRRPLEIADLDNDGRDDILGVCNSAICLNRQDNLGAMQPTEIFPMLTSQMDQSHGMVLADINSDGHKDAIVVLTVNGLMILYNSGR